MALSWGKVDLDAAILKIRKSYLPLMDDISTLKWPFFLFSGIKSSLAKITQYLSLFHKNTTEVNVFQKLSSRKVGLRLSVIRDTSVPYFIQASCTTKREPVKGSRISAL